VLEFEAAGGFEEERDEVEQGREEGGVDVYSG
jgi:hypothetical protein